MVHADSPSATTGVTPEAGTALRAKCPGACTVRAWAISTGNGELEISTPPILTRSTGYKVSCWVGSRLNSTFATPFSSLKARVDARTSGASAEKSTAAPETRAPSESRTTTEAVTEAGLIVGSPPQGGKKTLMSDEDNVAVVCAGSGVWVIGGTASNWIVIGVFSTCIPLIAVTLTSTSPGVVDVTDIVAFPSSPVVADRADACAPFVTEN